MGTISTTLFRGDSVAQTFFVESGEYRQGIFLANVELYFKAKDSNLPVTIEIRETIDGFPVNNEAIPFSEVTLDPSSVTIPGDTENITSILSAPTTFTFESPIHLPAGEYAILIYSNSDGFAVYTAQHGEIVIGSTETITRQAYIGSFFRSQNASTWTPEQDEDLMFALNKCVFDTSQSFEAIIKSPTYKGGQIISNFNDGSPITMDDAWQGFGGIVPMDGMRMNIKDGDFDVATIDYLYKATPVGGSLATTFAGFVPDENLEFTARKELSANGALTIQASMFTSDPDISPILDTQHITNLAFSNHISPGSLANNNVSLVTGGADYDGIPTVTVSAPTGAGGAVAVAVAEVTANVVTNIFFSNGGAGYVETPTLTISGANTTSVVAVATVNGETDKHGGNMFTRYITRRITLANGFDASFIKVLFDGYRPATGNFAIYTKILSGADPETFDDKDWILMTQVGSVVASANKNEYKEYEFESADPINYTSGTTTYNNFKTYAVKICMYDTNTVDPPKVRNLRVLAVD